MVTREQPGDRDEPLGLRDAFSQLNRRIDDVNARIDDLRSDVNARFEDLRLEMDARFKLLMWGIAIGFASVLAVLGALLARGG
ncbi:MAG: hypothetical protein F4088_02465 [Chloroflexi bacterium]|nr:hypothetical protein [Chloroflexota bacterium]MXV80811.1 hypothetical protein [Chloroflexota bacterium]MXX47269.1 hypothetical protein [Chloroflexota bacterium]MXY86858.1 hypothetical protein [Chloroflexota bacterium]MYC01871.1 hypothetical protein [Chloroflexota bacterium]